jgi:hypothetical protein
VLAKLSDACASAAKDEAYESVAKRAAQPPDYYDNAAGFGARLARDTAAKQRVISRINAKPK